ncbi:unnamed protein product [Prorocentrum cordatum]|uniref:rRNA-processing protein efg1 n=1 Tax=Prorocentrum cordatum TaxID=2364126 RepID=A0ABN9SP04_9DINO|nr:unnamed protein product [Polarella glacialis]
MGDDAGSRGAGRRSLHPGAEPQVQRERSPRLLRAAELPSPPAAPAEATLVPQQGTRPATDPSQDQLANVIEQQLRGYVSPEVQAQIKKTCNSLSAYIDSLQKLIDRQNSYTEQRNSLDQGTFPPGVRPFTLSYESPFLDTMRTSLDESLHIDISDMSIRDAKSKIYGATLAYQKKLDLEVLQRQREDLLLKTSRDAFYQECMSVELARTSPFPFLGLAEDDEIRVDPETIKPRLAIIYRKVVDQAAHRKQKKMDAANKEAAKKKKIAETVSQKPPAELLDMVIDARIDKAKRSANAARKKSLTVPASWYQQQCEGGLSEDVVLADLPANAPASGPKNGQSPAKSGGRGRGRGRSSDPKGKGKDSKGKGKGKDTSKGKSKGRATSKGKGGKVGKYGEGGDSSKGQNPNKRYDRSRPSARGRGRGGNGKGW